MIEIIKTEKGHHVIEYKTIRLIREHFSKEGSRYSVENIDSDDFYGILTEYRNLKLRFKDEAGQEREYIITHNHHNGNSVSVSAGELLNVPKEKEMTALRAINAFNAESCTMLVMGTFAPHCDSICMEDCIPDHTADEDVGKVVEDLIAQMEKECPRALKILKENGL